MSNKNKANKFLINFLAIMLALVLAGTTVLIGVLSNGFKDWSKFTVEQSHTGEASDMGSPVTDENGEELPSDEAVELPKAMTFSSAAMLDGEEAPYDSVTVTATVKPENATNKKVDWSVGFVDPDSSWATGKTVTDYVTITPESDGSDKAVIQCLQAFGEQIKVVATSRDNAAAKAECTVDFAKRITDIKYSDANNSEWMSANTGSSIIWPVFDATVSLSCYAEASDYTVDDYSEIFTEHSLVHFNVQLNAEYRDRLNDAGISIGSRGGFYCSLSSGYGNNTNYNFADDMNGGNNDVPFPKDEFFTWAYQQFSDNEYITLFALTAEIEGTYSTFTCTWNVSFPQSAFKVDVSGIDLDQSGVII